MKKIFLIFLISSAAVFGEPKAEKGVIDLRSIDFKEAGSLSLAGEWSHFRNLHYKTGIHFAPLEKSYSQIPVTFMDLFNKPVEYGTLELKMLLNPGQYYAVSVSGISAASRIWVNDKLLVENGKIGSSREDTKPYVEPSYLCFIPETEENYLYIEYSNFHLKEDVIFKTVEIGEPDKVLIDRYLLHGLEYFCFGFLTFIAIFHLILFLKSRRHQINLYFALFSLVYGIRSLLMGKIIVLDFAPFLNWDIIYKLTKVCELWALAAILMLFKKIFTREFRGKAVSFLVGLIMVWSLVFVLPVHILSAFGVMYLSHLVILAGGLLILFSLAKAVKNRRSSSVTMLISIVVFYGGSVNDILYNRFIIDTFYVGSFAIIWLISIMAATISKNRADSIHKASLKADLRQRTSNSFKRFVPFETLHLLGKEDISEVTPGNYKVKDLTLLFSDIRGYTTLSEKMTVKETFGFLNRYLASVGPEIRKNNGYIESYIGDAIKAVFSTSPQDAVNAAIGISSGIKKINVVRQKQNLELIRSGICIHHGSVLAGTVGTSKRMQTTVISHVSQTSKYMDRFASRTGVEILISEEVFSRLKTDSFQYIYLGRIRLKTTMPPVGLYEIFSSSTVINPEYKRCFNKAIHCIENKEYSKAIDHLKFCKKIEPGRRVADYYIQEINKSYIPAVQS